MPFCAYLKLSTISEIGQIESPLATFTFPSRTNSNASSKM